MGREDDICRFGDQSTCVDQGVDVLLFDGGAVFLAVSRSECWEDPLRALGAEQDPKRLYDAEAEAPQPRDEVDCWDDSGWGRGKNDS